MQINLLLACSKMKPLQLTGKPFKEIWPRLATTKIKSTKNICSNL